MTSWQAIGTELVQVLTAGSSDDPYSGASDDEDWDSPSSVDVMTLAPPEPRPSDEPTQDARNSVTSGWTLYLPRSTAVSEKNRVVVRGVTYPVVGVPAAWDDVGLVVQAYGTAG